MRLEWFEMGEEKERERERDMLRCAERSEAAFELEYVLGEGGRITLQMCKLDYCKLYL